MVKHGAFARPQIAHDIAEVWTELGKLRTFVANDRVSKFA